MIELSTYVFETLREDGELVLSRGRRKDDGSRLLAVEPVFCWPDFPPLPILENDRFREDRRRCNPIHSFEQLTVLKNLSVVLATRLSDLLCSKWGLNNSKALERRLTCRFL